MLLKANDDPQAKKYPHDLSDPMSWVNLTP